MSSSGEGVEGEEEESVEDSELTEEEQQDVEEEQEEVEEEQQESEEEEPGVVYMYRIPLEEDEGVSSPAYDPHVDGGLYMYHYAPNYLYIIQGKAAAHFHREDINVVVTELDKEEVEQSGNRVRDFT